MLEQLTRADIFWGLAILAGFLGMILYIILQHRVIIAQHGDLSLLAASLTDAVRQANANTKALDLLEPFATKVVPVELVRGFNAGADLLKTLTPDQVDLFIDQLKLFVKKATDNLPNTPEADGSVG